MVYELFDKLSNVIRMINCLIIRITRKPMNLDVLRKDMGTQTAYLYTQTPALPLLSVRGWRAQSVSLRLPSEA